MRAVMFQTDPPSRSIGGTLPTDSILNREEPDNVILGTSGLGVVVVRSRSRPILPSRSIGDTLPTDSILNREEPDNVILGMPSQGIVVVRCVALVGWTRCGGGLVFVFDLCS